MNSTPPATAAPAAEPASQPARGRLTDTELLFVCVQNAGRSQLAGRSRAAPVCGESACVRSASSKPAHKINPMAVQVLAERGITLTEAYQAAHQRRCARRRCHCDHGRRRCLSDLSWQALPRLGCHRPQRPAHRQRPRHPRRSASSHHRTVL
jgi:hypothetical protein